VGKGVRPWRLGFEKRKNDQEAEAAAREKQSEWNQVHLHKQWFTEEVDQSRDRPNRQLAVLVSGWSSQPTEVCANVIVGCFRASDAMWNVGDIETPELHCQEMNIYDWSLDDDSAFFLG
jgi:hypothetical protein